MLAVARAVAAVTTVAVVITAWTALTLYITFRFLYQNTVRKLILSCLRVDLKELNLNLVAFLYAGFFYCFEALPVDFADMEKAFLTRQNLYEAAVRHDALDCSFIHLAHFRHGYDGLDLGQGGFDALLVRS